MTVTNVLLLPTSAVVPNGQPLPRLPLAFAVSFGAYIVHYFWPIRELNKHDKTHG